VTCYLTRLEELGLAAATRKGALGRLRSFSRFLLGEGALTQDPTRGLSVRVGRSARPLLSREQVRCLLEASSRSSRQRPLAIRNRACLELLYGLGLRSREARSARVVDLSLCEGTLALRPAKGGPARTLPLPPQALPHLARYLEEGRPALTRERDPGHLLVTRRGFPLGRSDVNYLVGKAARRTDVPAAHPHAFRRALATHLMEEGASLRAIQLLLGHRSLASTEHYLGVDRSGLRQTVALLEGLE